MAFGCHDIIETTERCRYLVQELLVLDSHGPELSAPNHGPVPD